MNTLKLANLGNRTNLERIIIILSWLESDNICWSCKRTKSAFVWGYPQRGYCLTCVAYQLYSSKTLSGLGDQTNPSKYKDADLTCCLCGTGFVKGQRWFFMPNQGELSPEWHLWTHLHCFKELISDKQVKAHLLIMGY